MPGFLVRGLSEQAAARNNVTLSDSEGPNWQKPGEMACRLYNVILNGSLGVAKRRRAK